MVLGTLEHGEIRSTHTHGLEEGKAVLHAYSSKQNTAFTPRVELQIYCLWGHLCLPVCGLWNHREWAELEGTFPRLSGPIPCPRQGHHSSPLFLKPPIKLLLPPPLWALTVATANPDTSTCSMAQTRSSSPRRSCSLPPGQQSFAAFKTFARYQGARKGRVTCGSARGCRTSS